jgi:hypothetical protein
MDCRVKPGDDEKRSVLAARLRPRLAYHDALRPRHHRAEHLTRWSMLTAVLKGPSDSPAGPSFRMDCRIKSGNDERAKAKKGSGTPADVYSNLRILRCGARPCLFFLPRVRGRVGRGHARLSAFHCGSCKRHFRTFCSAPGQASWDVAGRSIRYGRTNRGAETLRSSTGVTRARLSQSRECTSRTGHSAGQMMPKAAPARIANSRGSTALAPCSGMPREHDP